MVLMRLLIFIIFPLMCLINNLSYSNNNVISANIELIKKDLIGTELTYVIKDKDTLINIARKYGISFADILSANGNMDPWLPKVDKKILIPKKHILPRAKRNGIVINLGDLRIYFFDRDKFIESYPIGIGRSGWETPTGIAKVTEKKIDPYWVPPESVREEDPTLPKVVAPGEDNPLGTRAIYLSMPSYLIHGTNKPYGVGMKVSHGCIRMYPEHVEKFYDLVQIGTKVNIIDQPIKAGWDNEELYIEVHSLPKYVAEDKSINVNDRKNFYPLATEVVQRAAGVKIVNVNWDIVFKAVIEAKGIPVKILKNNE